LKSNIQATFSQEAQLPQRDSASATHIFLGSLTDRALHWAPHLFYNYTPCLKKNCANLLIAPCLSNMNRFQ